jgi:type IV pilus assembly protein PilQ
MKKKIIMLLLAGMFALTACTSQKKLESDDDFSVEAEDSSGGDELSMDTPAESGESDDLSLDEAGGDSAEAKPADSAAPADPSQDADMALENELNSLDTPAENQAANNQQPADELSLDEPAAPADNAQVAQTPPAEGDIPPPSEVNLNDAAQAQTPPPEVPAEQVPPPEVAATEPPPLVDSAPITPDNGLSQTPATINTVQYKGNANGGTVAIGADQPLVYTTRFNPTTNQFIVEVQNSSIPKKLKRSLNTKDMASSIGSVDIYQKDGSNVSRFVVQLRSGAPEPIVQPEGNSLLIIGASADGSVVANNTVPVEPAPPAQDLTQVPPPEVPAQDPVAVGGEVPAPEENPKSMYMGSTNTESSGAGAETERVMTPAPATGLLSYENLEEFLMSNTRFYGKKISIETLGMDVTDALKFLSEESGVNIIFDDKVVGAGKVNIKLREVPWDQAFVLILKSKKLAYKRQGNVIRVSTVEDIRAEEDEAIKLKEARKKAEPFVVKRFFIAYAKVGEIKTKVEEYLKTLDTARVAGGGAANNNTTAGSVLVDERNNSLIVSDTEKNIKKIEEIIAVLDSQPKQILIEAKIVEATENFATGLGVKWKSTPSGVTGVNSGTINIGTDSVDTSGQFAGTITWGQLDFLGSLNASIALGESKNQLKTLSSPRITVLSGQQANITQTKTFSVPVTSISNGTVTQTETQKSVDLTLSVTPTATNEGTINLDLSVNRGVRQPPDGTLSSNAKTILFVRSGATAVVGGIYATTSNESDEGVPGIRKIPIIGSLFQSKQTTKDKNELVIFVTPTILKPL